MSNQSPEPSMTEPVSVAPVEVPAVPVEVPAGGVAEPKGLAAMTSNLKLIWENRNVRRLQLAFVGSEIGNWAYGMAILVWAYGKGGAVLVGTWAGIRMLLAAFSAPIGGAIADRVPRRTFMLANDAICLALILVTATMIWWDRNIWFVLVPATVLTVVQTAFRSAQAGLLPSLVDNPKQLTAANATSEIVNSGATFVGPAMAGLLLTVLGVVPVVLFNALSFIWSLYLVSRISTRAVTTESLADPSAGAASAVEHPGSETADDTVVAEKGDEVGGDEPAEEPFWKQTTRGFQAIGTDRDLLALTGLLGINGVLAGVLSVLVVLVAAQMLGDPAAVGWLNAVLGATTVLGGLVMLSLAGRVKLGRLVVWGVLGWCLPLIVLGIAPHIVVIVIVFAVIGLLDPMINVGFGVIPARLVEDRVLSRVYASIESLFVASAALGAFITPSSSPRSACPPQSSSSGSSGSSSRSCAACACRTSTAASPSRVASNCCPPCRSSRRCRRPCSSSWRTSSSPCRCPLGRSSSPRVGSPTCSTSSNPAASRSPRTVACCARRAEVTSSGRSVCSTTSPAPRRSPRSMTSNCSP